MSRCMQQPGRRAVLLGACVRQQGGQALLGMDVPIQNPALEGEHVMLDHSNASLHPGGEGSRCDVSCTPFYIRDLLSPFPLCSV